MEKTDNIPFQTIDWDLIPKVEHAEKPEWQHGRLFSFRV